jgi:anthrone oxygenase-like protein
MTISMWVATIASGLFAGASLYVSVVQHPAWVECGPALSVREFGPSARRAGAMQGFLAVVTLLSGAASWFLGAGVAWLAGGIVVGALAPYTFIVLMPVNRRLLDPGLDTGSSEARELFARWGRLHAVRTLVGVLVFVTFAVLQARARG